MKKHFYIIAAGTIIFLYLFFVKGYVVEDTLRGIGPVQVGDMISLPTVLTDIEGKTVRLGDKVLFIFFEPDCPLCTNEISYWIRVYERFDDTIDIVGLSRKKARDIEPYIRMHQIPYPVVSDIRGRLIRSFGIPGVPYNVITDNGEVVVAPNFPEIRPRIREVYGYLESIDE